MKKLNIVFSFVLLSFCLLINVSFAEIVANTDYDYDFGVTLKYTGVDSYSKIGYNETQLSSFISSLLTDGDTTLLDIMSSNNHSTYHYYSSSSSGSSYFFFYPSTYDVGACLENNSVKYLLLSPISQGEVYYITFVNGVADFFYSAKSDLASTKYTFAQLFDGTGEYPNLSGTWGSTNQVKEMSYTSPGIYRWDGISYYDPLPDEPETPTMPTNAEIASAVQMFYDSDYYKNNNDFDKFIVLYDNTTGLYIFIGHTVPEFLQQVIIPPHFRYQEYIFDVQWWKFELHENSGGPAYGSPYYLYVIDNQLENLEYRGKSVINSLIDSGPWATSNTVIVYSNYDYLVRTYVLNEETGDYVYTDGTIQGDQYTYDENLDITDNEYNPLDNFVTVDYPSTLVGNANFDSFLNTFNENKDVLILPQNANWVILANNSLFSHFSSFIIMCTLFIILQRVMRG